MAEILSRKALEHQFSPQVLKQVISQPADILNMKASVISVLVLDIENSTGKSTILNLTDYKAAIEETFDLFASACLKWDLTLDKFTGDGAQAFAGAPLVQRDDRQRVLQASLDFLRMLNARQDFLAQLWQGELRVRLAVTTGSALVGFVGRGRIRSFTVIGETVSLTHRLCAAAAANSVCVLNIPQGQPDNLIADVKSSGQRIVTNLKGFGSKQFLVSEYQPFQHTDDDLDLGRCSDCNTHLVFNTSAQGIMEISCPACGSKTNASIKSAA